MKKVSKIYLEDIKFRTSRQNYQVALFNQLCENEVKGKPKTQFSSIVAGYKVVYIFDQDRKIWTMTRFVHIAGTYIEKTHIFFQTN